jgi:phage tail P2-like protein
MGTPRTEAQVEGYAYRLLPDYIRDADAGTLATFLGKATASSIGPALRLVDVGDPDTSVTGTAELANPDAAPRTWLAWLAWLVGIDLANIPDAEKRTAISESSTLQRRGSKRAIIRATQRELTGSKSCRVYWNLSGTDPYLITVVTLTSQTPDSVAALAAAVTEKPAGVDMVLTDVAGATYAELAAAYADYDAVAAAFTDYDDLASWVPPTP